SNGYSDVSVAKGAREAITHFQSAHPEVSISEASNTVQPIEDNYDGSMGLLYDGAILAVVVVGWFLRDGRPAFLSAIALPLPVLPAFLTISLLGFSLNLVSLLALSLTVGILVDDAIVEVENIARHLRMGKTPYRAAMEAADEIGLAVIATTFTLVAVFLPTAFMSGVAGKVFKQFGWPPPPAVVASLRGARRLTPALGAHILKPIVDSHREPRWLAAYMRMAEWCLKHRFTTMVLATLFFFGSVAMIPLLKTGFIPPDDNSQTQVYLSLAPGST